MIELSKIASKQDTTFCTQKQPHRDFFSMTASPFSDEEKKQFWNQLLNDVTQMINKELQKSREALKKLRAKSY